MHIDIPYLLHRYSWFTFYNKNSNNCPNFNQYCLLIQITPSFNLLKCKAIWYIYMYFVGRYIWVTSVALHWARDCSCQKPSIELSATSMPAVFAPCCGSYSCRNMCMAWELVCPVLPFPKPQTMSSRPSALAPVRLFYASIDIMEGSINSKVLT